MGYLGLRASLGSGVLKESQASKARRARWELRVPRATKDNWERWVSPETPALLVPQALKGPEAPWDQRVLQDGWGPKESQDWLAMMDTKALWDPLGLLDPKARRGNREMMARPRAPLGHLEIGVPWGIEETVESLGTLDTLVRRESKASVESQASRASPGIRDPRDGRDPKDRKVQRAPRENQARLGQ